MHFFPQILCFWPALLTEKNLPVVFQTGIFVTDQFDENLYLSARNIVNVDTAQVSSISPVSLVAFEKVVVTVDAIKKIEELYQ